MSHLREIAAKAAADAQGDLKQAWPAFYHAAMAAEAEKRLNFYDELPINEVTFPEVFSVSREAMRRTGGDREWAAAVLHEQLDRRENPTVVFRLESERRMKLWPLLVTLVREACEAVKKRRE